MLIGGLGEDILVPFAPDVGILVRQTAHYAAGAAALREIAVEVRRKSTLEYRRLHAPVFDIGVCASAYSILILRFISEFIVAARVEVFAIEKSAPSLALELGIDAA